MEKLALNPKIGWSSNEINEWYHTIYYKILDYKIVEIIARDIFIDWVNINQLTNLDDKGNHYKLNVAA